RDLDPGPVRRVRVGARRDRRDGDRRHLDHGRAWFGPRHRAGGAARADRHLRGHPAGLAQPALPAVRRDLHHRRGGHRPAAPARTEGGPVSETTKAPKGPPPAETATTRGGTGVGARVLRAVLTQRIILLVVLIAVLLAWLFGLSAGDYLLAPFDAQYASTALLNAVPLAMLALGELVVIVSGRGGIDLSLGSIVSL